MVVHLRGNVVPCNVWVRVESPEAHARWRAKHFADDQLAKDGAFEEPVDNDELPRGAAQARVGVVGSGVEAAIWMPYFRQGNAFDAGKLAHEAVHVAWRMLDAMGTDDEELHCYVVQWIVREFTERHRDRRTNERSTKRKRPPPHAAGRRSRGGAGGPR